MTMVMIDDGSNYIKLCANLDGKNETLLIPSRVIRKALPSMSTTGFSDASYEIDDNRFSFSKSAVGTIPTNNRQYQVSEHNRVLIHHALKKANVSGDVEVVTTLPIGQFFNPDGSKNEKLIASKIKNIKGDITYLDGAKKANVTACYVLPEGVPAFVYAKQELNLSGSRYLLVDIGGTTTDLVVINDDDQIEQFESVNVGALKMLSEFSTIVSEKLQLSELTDEIVINGLLNGVIAGEDVSDIASRIIQSFEHVINESMAKFGEVRLFDAVIFSGGGANLFKSSFVNVLKTKEPQFDNARGALILMG